MKTSLPAISELAQKADALDLVGAPEAEFVVAPSSAEETGRVLQVASEQGLQVLIWGGGSHQGIGGRVEADVLLSTSQLSQITEWEADDLTLVTEAGVSVAEIEEKLGERNQTALLPESMESATVGGIIAAGLSGWQRLRYGPTRDRMLEVVLVTGDGRSVRGGGRVVKNVTGYDLPRLATGSLGSLGVITQVCLKLWPRSETTATVTLDDPDRAGSAHRPLAMIEDQNGLHVYLGGHPEDIDAQVQELGGAAVPELRWPPLLTDPIVMSLRIPPRAIHEGRPRIPDGWNYQIEHGVGQIWLGAERDGFDAAQDLRPWAESIGGSLVLMEAPESVYQQFDPWGSPPASIDIQRRMVAQFDPMRILNRGRLPGGL